MADLTRRDLMKSSTALLVASRLGGFSTPALTNTSALAKTPVSVWAHHVRTLIAEGYSSPFYPFFE